MKTKESDIALHKAENEIKLQANGEVHPSVRLLFVFSTALGNWSRDVTTGHQLFLSSMVPSLAWFSFGKPFQHFLNRSIWRLSDSVPIPPTKFLQHHIFGSWSLSLDLSSFLKAWRPPTTCTSQICSHSRTMSVLSLEGVSKSPPGINDIKEVDNMVQERE